MATSKRQRCADDLPDELLVRIMSLLLSSRHLCFCMLVSKRWRDLARRVTHFRLDSPIAAAEESLIRWFHPDCGSDLRYLAIARLPRSHRNNVSSTLWLEQIGKSLRSLAIHGARQQKFDRFWSSVSSCQELRCLHINADVCSNLPALPPPLALLPKLLYCTLSCLGVSGVRRLLEQCPSLVFLRIETIKARLPRTTTLKSESLDCLEISSCGGDCKEIFSLAIEMPRLRWLLASFVPCVELRPSTSSVEWMLLHGDVRHRRVSYSSGRLRSLTITRSFRDLEHVMQRLAPVVSSRMVGIRELTLLVEFKPRSINLAVFLEMFQRLEVLRIARPTIEALSLEDWSWRHSPLIVQVDAAYTRHEDGAVRESGDIEFLWDLMSSSSCVTMLELGGFVYKGELDGFRPKVPAAFEQLSQAFPGRVKIEPLRSGLEKKCGVDWRSWENKVRTDALYTTMVQHQCKEMHLHETSFEGCAWDWQ